MEHRTFLDGLNASELEVEFLVRGLSSTEKDANACLNKLICLEQDDKEVRPKQSHIMSNPQVEAETCKVKAQELNSLSAGLGISHSIHDGWLVLTRAKHWRDRTERLLSTFGNNSEVSATASSLRRIVNWHKKCINDFHSTLSKTSKNQPFLPSSNSSPNGMSQGQDKLVGNSFLASQKQNANPSAKAPVVTTIGFQTNTTTSNPLSSNPGGIASVPPSMFNDDVPLSVQQLIQNVSNQLNVSGNPMRDNLNQCQSQLNPSFVHPSGSALQPPNFFASNLPQPMLSQISHNPPRQNDRRFLPENDYKIRQRWNISYDGKIGKNVRDFVYKLEMMANGDEYPVQNLTRMLHLFLEGKANDWFWIFKQSNPVVAWNEMKNSLVSYFDSFDSEEETKEEIIRRTQGPRESFADFCLEIQKLNGRLVNRLSENEIIKRLFNNMHPALRNMILACQSQIQTIDDLRIICTRYESHWNNTGFDPRKNYDTQYRRRAFVNEFHHEINEPLSFSNQILSNNSVIQESVSPNHLQSQPLASGYVVNPILSPAAFSVPLNNSQAVHSNFQSSPQSQHQCTRSYPEFINPNSITHRTSNDSDLIFQVQTLDKKVSEIAALLQNQSMRDRVDSTGKLVCWNCFDLGHPYQDCPQQLLHEFCFGCGTPNVRKPECMKCERKKYPGNVWMGATSREQRPQKNLTTNSQLNQMPSNSYPSNQK